MTPWRERQSYGAEETFPRDILEKGPLLEFLRECAERVFAELEEEGKLARTVTLKIKYADFQLSPGGGPSRISSLRPRRFSGRLRAAGAHRGRPPAGPPGRHLAVQLRSAGMKKDAAQAPVVQATRFVNRYA